MRRAARPSDLYRLPGGTPAGAPRPATDHTGSASPARSTPQGSQGAPQQAPQQAPPPDPHQPSGRRPPRWLLAGAGTIALVVVVALLVLPDPSDAPAPDADQAGALVDVVAEDTAVAALALHEAEAAAIEAVQVESPLAPPGPDAVVRAVADGQEAVRAALSAAQLLPEPVDPAAAAYLRSPEHSALLGRLAALEQHARAIALLTATHDTLYGGGGAVDPVAVQQQLTSWLNAAVLPGPAAVWASHLLEQLDGRDRAAEAATARAATDAAWPPLAAAVAPAAMGELAVYLATVPPATLRALRGHPVAGPALRRLGVG